MKDLYIVSFEDIISEFDTLNDSPTKYNLIDKFFKKFRNYENALKHTETICDGNNKRCRTFFSEIMKIHNHEGFMKLIDYCIKQKYFDINNVDLIEHAFYDASLQNYIFLCKMFSPEILRTYRTNQYSLFHKFFNINDYSRHIVPTHMIENMFELFDSVKFDYNANDMISLLVLAIYSENTTSLRMLSERGVKFNDESYRALLRSVWKKITPIRYLMSQFKDDKINYELLRTIYREKDTLSLCNSLHTSINAIGSDLHEKTQIPYNDIINSDIMKFRHDLCPTQECIMRHCYMIKKFIKDGGDVNKEIYYDDSENKQKSLRQIYVDGSRYITIFFCSMDAYILKLIDN